MTYICSIKLQKLHENILWVAVKIQYSLKSTKQMLIIQMRSLTSKILNKHYKNNPAEK